MSSKNAGNSTRSFPLTNPLDLFRDPTVLLRRIQEKTGQARSPVEVRPDTWLPAIEMTQSDDHVEVVVELPGIEWMDVRLEVVGNRLVVQGERRHDIPSDVIPRSVRRAGKKYGHFYREIELPQGADVDHIQANMKNGLLRVTIPLVPERPVRRVLVQSTNAPSEPRG